MLIIFFSNNKMAKNCFSSLPYRQLRKGALFVVVSLSSSLPYRQLRKEETVAPSIHPCSLPYRQLRKDESYDG